MGIADPDSDLAYAGPAALAAAVRGREVRPRELVELFLRRIEKYDGSLGAFRVVLAESALAEADAVEAAGVAGAGKLAGVPVAIKDDMPVAGQAMTYGSRSPARPQPADGEVVARLRRAGAIPIGITNVPELMAFPWTATDANGVTRNPWDPARTPGGSSGGSAAAVAAGLAATATGSDGGGSIRIPAACCGLVGMKSTRGLVPTAPREELTLGLTVLGALARTTGDSALMLDVLAGSDRFGAAAARADPGRSLRIAVSRKVPPGLLARLSGDQRLAFDRTARLLGELGHQIIDRDPAYGLLSLEFTQTFLRGVAELGAELEDPSLMERSTRQICGAARRLVPERRRAALLRKRPRTTERILALWDAADLLLTPVLASTALPAEGGHGRGAVLALDRAARFMPWNPLANVTGLPAIAIPAGFGADGLPTAVQLVGRPGSEELLYAVAAQLEAARPWAPDRPPLFP